jgi:hypothetical protein
LTVTQIPLAQIRLDQSAQPRTHLDTAVTAEYAEAMAAGAVFPPVTVFHDAPTYWLADGFHRIYAARSAGLREIACHVSEGSLRDAILYSCRTNATHGLRRTDEDKRRAVRALLNDAEWAAWSDREIARQCAVSHPFVGRIREELKPAHLVTLPDSRRMAARAGGAPYAMDTSKIGPAPPARASAGPAKTTAPLASDSLVPPPHAAIVVLARGIADIQAEPEEIVSGCLTPDDADDLREACGQAVAALGAVLRVLDPVRPAATD